MKAAHQIVNYYPNAKPDPNYLAELINTLVQYPETIMDKLADVRSGVAAYSKEFLPSIPLIVEMGDRLRTVSMESEAKASYYSSLKVLSMDAYDDLRRENPEEVERRKAIVAQELGYDPSHAKRSKWCFDPTKPPENAPWHSPDELAASAKRIKAESGSVEFEASK